MTERPTADCAAAASGARAVEDELISLDDEPEPPGPRGRAARDHVLRRAARPRPSRSSRTRSRRSTLPCRRSRASRRRPRSPTCPSRRRRSPNPSSVEDVKHVKVRSNIDILAELEKLRKDATAAPVSERPAKRQAPGISIDDLLASSLNHRKEINRIFELQVPRGELAGGHQVRVGLRIEDREQNPVGDEKTFAIELHTRPDLEKLLLSLKFHIFAK